MAVDEYHVGAPGPDDMVLPPTEFSRPVMTDGQHAYDAAELVKAQAPRPPCAVVDEATVFLHRKDLLARIHSPTKLARSAAAKWGETPAVPNGIRLSVFPLLFQPLA
jgi:hypothetical protein